MPQARLARPLSVTISDIRLRKFDGSFEMSIFPQLAEINLYSSVYAPLQRAEVTLYDAIGLLSNFPLVGEEFITFDLATTGTSDIQSIRMIATKPVNIIPDDKGRAVTFTLMCYSPEILLNNVIRLQECYYGPISDTVQKILQEKLQTNKKITIEPSKGTQKFIAPNMYPLETIRLLAQLAVPEQYSHYNYMFFENSTGFHFETTEKLITANPKSTFKYYSQTVPTNQQDEFYRIIDLTQNKRYDTLEKQTMGFYSNELYEIDLVNKKVISSKTFADENKPDPITIEPGQINTPEFITKMKTTPRSIGHGTASRVRYRTRDGARDGQPSFLSDKFGIGNVHRTAMNQSSITIVVPGDSRITAGDVVNLSLPEFHGFNRIDLDPYLSGKYLVTEARHKIRVGEKHIMILNLNRDSYNKPIGETRYPT